MTRIASPRHIFLDSYPTGALSHPKPGPDALAVIKWAAGCRAAGHIIYVPEVIDYEVRRELVRAGKAAGIAKLNALQTMFQYIPITTAAMLRAADLWAQSRSLGLSTGDPKKLDVDAILAAQALTSGAPPTDIVVATTNVNHLAQFVTADLWSNIG